MILLLFLIILNYISGLLIVETACKRLFLLLGLVLDVATLIFFKYLNFILFNIESMAMSFNNMSFSFGVPEIVMPIGISFFTFQIMSYLIDVYRGTVTAQKNVAWLAMYVMMFPQLIAGPIVRYNDINKEIGSRVTTLEMAEVGIKRFIIGFAKKIFIANCMGSMADAIFAADGTENSLFAWLGAICYAMQIFYDFSAYSDMAIGLGLIFGFHFNENFNYPYTAKSIQEFWRRWHISLSTWFKDYIYIPLGGNRCGQTRTYINLSIVFLLTGIWHGAAWQFIVWGIWHGAFQLIERAGLGKVFKEIPSIFSRIYTLLVVIIGWVFFRAESLSSAIVYLKNMFTFNFKAVTDLSIIQQFNSLFFITGLIALAAATSVVKKFSLLNLENTMLINRVTYLMLFIISTIYLSGMSYNPFIYFQF